jgi:hypothetical protein
MLLALYGIPTVISREVHFSFLVAAQHHLENPARSASHLGLSVRSCAGADGWGEILLAASHLRTLPRSFRR